MLFTKNGFVEILCSAREPEAVRIAAVNLKSDLFKVLASRVCLSFTEDGAAAGPARIFGVQNGTCPMPEELRLPRPFDIKTVVVATRENLTESPRIAASAVAALIPGHKEGFVLAVRNGVLYLCGNDRRGTIYAVYEFCERLGVSPWHFFADVPPRQRDRFELAEGFTFADYPSVEYRGIFINDEEELEKWVVGYMAEDTIGPKTYAHIFELLLRLKCNYLWPAMHVNSFNANVENGALAEKMGIVIGTSHCDMLMRSNNREWEPWKRKKGYTDLSYDFSIEGENREKLLEYWRESVEQNHDFEVTYTLGMRGIHDSGFNTAALKGLTGEELLKARIALLTDVFRAQDQILKEVPHKEALKIFVPYKEVLPLYDGGLPVPDDYTLIWTNDNYGYVRRYPDSKARQRSGGHGIYYHQSYWAPPDASYLFICSIPAAQTRYELSKAYDNGIRRLWVTNFGAIKPLEQHMSYYAALAWNIGKENDPTRDVTAFLAGWLDRTFTGGFGSRLAPLLTDFDQVVNMRKIEQMDNGVFYQSERQDDAAGRIRFLRHVFDEVNEIYRQLPRREQDAFFEMVLMRIHAAYYTNAMYYYADRSQLTAGLHHDAEADRCFRLAEDFDRARQALLYYYNHIMANGKWNGIVTPEDFPPPRTAMYPAAVSPEKSRDIPPVRPLPVSDCVSRVTVEAREASELNGASWPQGIRIIPHLGRGCGDLVELSDPAAALTYELTLPVSGPYALTIERFPSLNSVGEIGVTVSLDGHAVKRLISDANDEHRGSWRENILNNRDLLSVRLGTLPAGRHTVTLSEGTKYFALTRFHVYEWKESDDPAVAPTIRNHFWHGRGLNPWLDREDEPVPADTAQTIREFYPGAVVTERPQLVLPRGYSGNGVANEDIYWYEPQTACASSGQTPYTAAAPSDSCIRIRVADALRQTPQAYTTGAVPDSCIGIGRKEISLYFRSQDEIERSRTAAGNEAAGSDAEAAGNAPADPGVCYTTDTPAGRYTLWLCLYTKGDDEYCFQVTVDGKALLPDAESARSLWRYPSENAYKWIPLSTLDLSEGAHTVAFFFHKAKLRLEGIALQKE